MKHNGDRWRRDLGLALLAHAIALCASSALPACVERTREPPKPRVVARAPAKPTQVSVPAPPPLSSPAPIGAPVRLLAKRFVVKVRNAPAGEAPRIGYLRGGVVMQALTAQPIGFDQCRKGWYELATGGFLCSTLDVMPFLGPHPPERQPRLPDLTTPLPYPYGYSRKENTPVFRRLPTASEAAFYENSRARRPPTQSAKQSELQRARAAIASISPRSSALPAPVWMDPVRVTNAGGGNDEADAQESGVPTLASLMGDQDTVLMRRMERGFYVSLDREMEKGERSYWRTQSNGFIAAAGLSLVDGSAFHGVALKEQSSALPVAFVMSKDSFSYKLDARGQAQHAAKPGYHFVFPVASEGDVHGGHYQIAADGQYFRARDVTRVDARERPVEISADEKWIDVDLSKQSLVAYIGSEPVYVTLISSGRIKDELDPQKNFETPVGAYRILSKHLTATMDGDHALDGPYSIEDVPYVMYFQLAYALHSAFWHNSFGRPHSHGCINLAPLDARWLFEFVEPTLPPGWHGVFPTPEHLATRLYIHGTTPPG